MSIFRALDQQSAIVKAVEERFALLRRDVDRRIESLEVLLKSS